MITEPFIPPNYESEAALEEDYKNLCILGIMFHLVQHEPFIKALEELRKYPLAYSVPYNVIVASETETSLIESKERQKQIKEYYAKLRELAYSYGLKPEWALERLHRGVRDIVWLFVSPRVTKGFEPEERSIVWNMYVGQNKKEIRDFILRRFEEQWNEAEWLAKDLGLKETYWKGYLEDHTRWVFKKVCLGKKWKDIAEEEKSSTNTITIEDRTATTIKRKANTIMKLLGLKPANSLGGRPRKH